MSKRNRAIEEAMEEEIKLELTPMIDICFLIIIFFMCLPFKTLEGKLQAFLPTDKGINPIPLDPPNEIKIHGNCGKRGRNVCTAVRAETDVTPPMTWISPATMIRALLTSTPFSFRNTFSSVIADPPPFAAV